VMKRIKRRWSRSRKKRRWRMKMTNMTILRQLIDKRKRLRYRVTVMKKKNTSMMAMEVRGTRRMTVVPSARRTTSKGISAAQPNSRKSALFISVKMAVKTRHLPKQAAATAT